MIALSATEVPMTPTQFKLWRDHMGLTKTKAGEFLGISSRTIDLYESGQRVDDGVARPVEIPKAIELACAALASGIRSYSGPSFP